MQTRGIDPLGHLMRGLFDAGPFDTKSPERPVGVFNPSNAEKTRPVQSPRGVPLPSIMDEVNKNSCCMVFNQPKKKKKKKKIKKNLSFCTQSTRCHPKRNMIALAASAFPWPGNPESPARPLLPEVLGPRLVAFHANVLRSDARGAFYPCGIFGSRCSSRACFGGSSTYGRPTLPRVFSVGSSPVIPCDRWPPDWRWRTRAPALPWSAQAMIMLAL